MSGSFTFSIPNLSILNIGATKRSEASEILEMFERAMQVMVSSHATSISFKDRNGTAAGTLTWTPVASAVVAFAIAASVFLQFGVNTT